MKSSIEAQFIEILSNHKLNKDSFKFEYEDLTQFTNNIYSYDGIVIITHIPSNTSKKYVVQSFEASFEEDLLKNNFS